MSIVINDNIFLDVVVFGSSVDEPSVPSVLRSLLFSSRWKEINSNFTDSRQMPKPIVST